MTNQEKYDNVFVECFAVGPEVLNNEFVYQCIPAWDSIGHMSLIALLEQEFDFMMDMDDVIDFGSYTKGIELLRKYDIEI
jgi:acyl carrier protein